MNNINGWFLIIGYLLLGIINYFLYIGIPILIIFCIYKIFKIFKNNKEKNIVSIKVKDLLLIIFTIIITIIYSIFLYSTVIIHLIR